MRFDRLILLAYKGISSLAGLVAWPFFYRHLKSRGGGESFPFRLGLKAPPDPPPGSPRLWIHGVSVGEIASAPPLVAELRRRLPGASFTISTGTETGQAVARRLFEPQGALVCYFPLDLPWAVNRALTALRPDAFIALESELWPNFLTRAQARGVRLALLNARLSDRSFRRYARFPRLAAAFFDLFGVIAAGAPEDRARLERLGVRQGKLKFTGNLKVDRLLTAWQERRQAEGAWPPPLPCSSGPCSSSPPEAVLFGEHPPPRPFAVPLHLGGQPVFLAASTHAGEEEVVLEAYRRLLAPYPALVLLLAPRHPERAGEVEGLAARHGLVCQRFSRLRNGMETREAPMVLVDTIGDLLELYGAADVAFVGGSLIPHGGQNILEPAVWGLAPLAGPHLDNFRWAQEILTAAEALTIVADAASLTAAAQSLLDHPALRRQMGSRAREALLPHRGAAARQADLVVKLLAGSPERFAPPLYPCRRPVKTEVRPGENACRL
jgi:3-deoxy-D-manno-octulosonic-acid transferase